MGVEYRVYMCTCGVTPGLPTRACSRSKVNVPVKCSISHCKLVTLNFRSPKIILFLSHARLEICPQMKLSLYKNAE